MKLAWRVYRTLCVYGFSIMALVAIVTLCFGRLNEVMQFPVATSVAPDGHKQLLVFSAGQGNVPPDYRANVRFVLYDPARLFGMRSQQIASAAFADGWSLAWQGSHALTIQAGRLSWFDQTVAEAWGVAITVQIAQPRADERVCIGRAFRSTIDGVTCFDGLLGAARPPP